MIQIIKKAFGDLMTRIYFVDLSMPMDAFSQLLEGEKQEACRCSGKS